MPHRPADSRLLSNLLSHEKDYVRSLHSQLDYGQASLASFSAYAAASSPPASRAIGSVATALVGAQDALRGYVSAVEEWCEQLKLLKDMENEVGNITRDREILVDRLIKASKANNPKRRSLLPSSTSNQGSPIHSSPGHSLDQLAFSNSKLNLAQSELQACETHLTEKERVLTKMRESCVVGGLKMRCRALAECGLKWSEVGNIGLQALDSLNTRSSFDQHIPVQKPLPDINYPYQRPSSDHSSSLAPSQSASQVFHPQPMSDQYHPSTSSSCGAGARGPAPEADIRDEPRFELSLPPAHAISEEDHYTPPQARIQERIDEEDEAGGSSLEEDQDERKYEVHENPLFSHPLAPGKGKQNGSKTRLPLKLPKRLDSASATNLPTSASAPLPSHPSSSRFGHNDPFGTSSSGKAYSDGQQSTPRTRKRSTFFGLGALSNLFHHKRSVTEPTADSGALSSSPKKEKWHTRTDKNLKKVGKDDNSDEEEEPTSTQANFAPIRTASVDPTTPPSGPPSRPVAKGDGVSRPSTKRTPSAGRKLRKVSDGATQRKVSTSSSKDVHAPQQPNEVKTDVPTAVGSASVSRSSTILTNSTAKSGQSARPASLDLHPKAKHRASSDAGHKPPGNKGTHRRRSSSPPTNGQMSLLSIVEDVTKQNRQGWQQANPNNLLFEVKAPRSVYHTFHLDEPVSGPSNYARASSDIAGGAAGSRRRESPLRNQLLDGYKRNSFSASTSEPSLPLKQLPPTPSPAPKAPLRSALRNRSGSPSPATSTPPRATSPMQHPQPNGGPSSGMAHLPLKVNSAGSSVNDDDTASVASAYETGHEDFDSDPPTPTAASQPSGQDHQQQVPSLPNGHGEAKSGGSHTSGSDTAGTETPPSRRKSVRVSLRPTFSPTPPATTDYEDDHPPWGPEPPSKLERSSGMKSSSGWASSRKTGDAAWEDSSDEDEEYSRAREMLLNATQKMRTVYKG